jgi:hypothetical protein
MKKIAFVVGVISILLGGLWLLQGLGVVHTGPSSVSPTASPFRGLRERGPSPDFLWSLLEPLQSSSRARHILDINDLVLTTSHLQERGNETTPRLS